MKTKIAKLLMIPIVIASLICFGCSTTDNPVGIDENEINSSPIEKSIRINTDDFSFALHDGSLAKLSGLQCLSCKWHYNNLILPKQGGKLYWCIKTHCKDGVDDRALAKKAFSVWQPYVPFVFTETTNPAAANIVIVFRDSSSYTDPFGEKVPWVRSCTDITLGYSWSPYETTLGLGFDYKGDMFINDFNAAWSAGKSCVVKSVGCPTRTVNISLLGQLTHEIGHCLGLSHDACTSSIMSADITNKELLCDNDILYITQFYNIAYQLYYSSETQKKIIIAEFQKCLKRSPSATELSSYSVKLTNNRLPSKRAYDYHLLVADLLGSTEKWNSCNKVYKTYIAQVFAILLGRQPLTGEISIYEGRIKAGWTLKQVVLDIMKTSEWNCRFARNVYTSITGVTFSSTQLSTVVNKMTSGKIVPDEVYVEALRSQTCFNLSTPKTNTGYINRIYSLLLKRSPTSSELFYWVNRID